MTMIKVLVVLLVVKTAYSQTIVPLSLCETTEVNVRENSEGVVQHVQNAATSGNCTLILNILGNSGHVYLQGIMDYTKASPCGKTKQLNINDKLYCVNTEPSKAPKIIVTRRIVITAEKSNLSFTITYNTQGNFNCNSIKIFLYYVLFVLYDACR